MAKDVDLSSKEWRDLVFEGKNQEYGAYELRKDSPKRHNLAVIAVISITAIIVAVVIAFQAITKMIDEAKPKVVADQELMDLTAEAETAPEEEMPEEQYIPPEQEEVIQEELLNTEKQSQIMVVDDAQAEEIRSQDEAQQSETAAGLTNEDRGVDDIINAQQHVDVVVVEEKKPEPPEDNQIFTSVEQDPQFPGGQGALLQYLAKNLRYPTICQENGIQGRVIVQFVVTKNGTVGQVKVAKGVHPELDAEAIRVIKTLPKFTPGKMNGHPVNVWYTVPVVFKLQGL